MEHCSENDCRLYFIQYYHGYTETFCKSWVLKTIWMSSFVFTTKDLHSGIFGSPTKRFNIERVLSSRVWGVEGSFWSKKAWQKTT